MKRYLLKGVLMVLVMVGLVAAAQPALAWVRVGIGLRVPFPVVVVPVAAVVAAPVVYAPHRPVHYRPVWIPGHFNRWGAWVPAHWR
jgi:hypothetical protein